MNSAEEPPNSSPQLSPEDLAILSGLSRGNEWLRAVLCTLARRGVAFRQRDGDRARQLLTILSPFPWYKGGQFLFDLMEWQDFMMEGPLPEVLPTTLNLESLQRLARLLQALQGYLDGSIETIDAAVPKNLGLFVSEIKTPSSQAEDAHLPPLEPGFYLYQDVVLGLISSIKPVLGTLSQANTSSVAANEGTR